MHLAAVGTNVHEKSRSDFCRLRFKTQGLSRMYALSRDVTAPGVVVYDSGMSTDLVYLPLSLADRPVTQYDRLLASSCALYVCFSVCL